MKALLPIAAFTLENVANVEKSVPDPVSILVPPQAESEEVKATPLDTTWVLVNKLLPEADDPEIALFTTPSKLVAAVAATLDAAK